MTLTDLRNTLPDYAKDLKLNLDSVLSAGGSPGLDGKQIRAIALACAIAARHAPFVAAVEAFAAEQLSPEELNGAKAAAAIMAMNNVYYRFRHHIEKPSYADRPARLRMNRLVKPAASKVDFELYALAASAVIGCEWCMRSHERVVVEGGLTEEQVHDAIRIAATINGAAIALEVA
jgi:alkyl hydroperoxide reductase subunit D